ncbi:N-6 DNA methylase [uncultured Rhodoblastus sp.]|uniref:N-6 DNA methylase n=1 Tax=uncultured Rhodoblastus sp. TaxID=543037 RepID=UPI0025F3E24D|nr:N-6 DNA methylase [uncultured Rhodoblastus sp.]
MDLSGIENEAEFFPAGTLSDALQDELREITSRWSSASDADNPAARLTQAADPYLAALRQMRNPQNRERRAELRRNATYALATALGYDYQRLALPTSLDGAPFVPLIGRVADAEGRDLVWLLEAPLEGAEDESSDPLGGSFSAEQFAENEREFAETGRAIEEILGDGIFGLRNAPQHVLIFALSQIVLVSRHKWPARSVLRFDLQEIFTRKDADTLAVMACLISREARVPRHGIPIADRIEEEAQRNANAVTTSLKGTVRDAIEFLGQEVLDITGGKYPAGPRQGVWIDGPELSLECLRFMYRLLFLFYAEANPRLNILDLRDPVYASGYSVEALRELESVRLRTPAEKNGTYLWDSLQRTLTLLYDGTGNALRLPAVKVALLDPEQTPILNAVRLRNEAIQKVIRLLSLKKSRSGTGRISYAKLGIGQLGAVYETLISFTGVVAKQDLIELRPQTGRGATEAEEEGQESGEAEAEEGDEMGDAPDDEIDEEEVSRNDRVELLAPSYFVARSRINEFSPEEIVFRGPEARIYKKGTFIYRLAGRDREKSASYYTPEPLARLLVKHALMERCKGLPADELLELKILEPAMGSAAFLVETTNQLADLYLERKQQEVGRTIPQDQILHEKQKVRSFIADRNCFGVDLNPVAVELGAISLWLNGLHASDFSPWFGDRLHAGNSLIGARRASYPPALMTVKKKGDLWFNEKPQEIGWKGRLPAGQIWQWLLPAKDMAKFDKDKSIEEFAREAQEKIKAWRSGGFFDKLEPHEVKLLQKLSRVAEELFDIVAADLAKSRIATSDAITLWPDKIMPGAKGVDFHVKDQRNRKLIGAEHASNTLPYHRLKTAMDG